MNLKLLAPPTQCPNCFLKCRSASYLGSHIAHYCPALAGRRPLSDMNPDLNHALIWMDEKQQKWGADHIDGMKRLADAIRAL